MSYPVKQSVTATCDANGAATVYTDNVRGRLVSVQYTKSNFADGVGFTITSESSSLALLTTTNSNASATWYPVVAGSYVGNGAASTTLVSPYVVNERVKIVTASGGSGTVGTFAVTVE